MIWKYAEIAENESSVTRRDCAEGGPVFAHEIGHNLGADHNKEQGKNIHHDDGHGHFIRGGYRTIMAYCKPGYNKWINYFSNPEVSYLGSPTGVYGEATNAQLATMSSQARWRYQARSHLEHIFW